MQGAELTKAADEIAGDGAQSPQPEFETDYRHYVS